MIYRHIIHDADAQTWLDVVEPVGKSCACTIVFRETLSLRINPQPLRLPAKRQKPNPQPERPIPEMQHGFPKPIHFPKEPQTLQPREHKLMIEQGKVWAPGMYSEHRGTKGPLAFPFDHGVAGAGSPLFSQFIFSFFDEADDVVEIGHFAAKFGEANVLGGAGALPDEVFGEFGLGDYGRGSVIMISPLGLLTMIPSVPWKWGFNLFA